MDFMEKLISQLSQDLSEEAKDEKMDREVWEFLTFLNKHNIVDMEPPSSGTRELTDEMNADIYEMAREDAVKAYTKYVSESEKKS